MRHYYSLLIVFITCSCIYRITSDIRGGKYKHRIILHLKIHLIYFKVCMWIYNIIRNITWGIYENWTILHLITQLTISKSVAVYMQDT